MLDSAAVTGATVAGGIPVQQKSLVFALICGHMVDESMPSPMIISRLPQVCDPMIMVSTSSPAFSTGTSDPHRVHGSLGSLPGRLMYIVSAQHPPSSDNRCAFRHMTRSES